MKTIVILCIALSLLAPTGCASTRFGKDLDSQKAPDMTTGIRGKGKEALIKTLGDPDFITAEGGSEYWGYHRRDAWHLNLYYGSAGKNQASDLVVKLEDGMAMDAFVIAKGSSVGIIADPLSVRDEG